MRDYLVLRSSEVDPDLLDHVLANEIAGEQARRFRRFFVVRLALVLAAAWLLSWPVHLLPHTVVWALLATMAFVIGLMSPPRHRAPTADTPTIPRH
jgi:hypothetical protein